MNALEVLKQARALISDPAQWTQGHYARDAEGFGTNPWEADAVCWCASGAIQRVDPFDEVAWGELAKQLAQQSSLNIPQFNDLYTHAEVLALYDAAIARLETQVPPC